MISAILIALGLAVSSYSVLPGGPLGPQPASVTGGSPAAPAGVSGGGPASPSVDSVLPGGPV